MPDTTTLRSLHLSTPKYVQVAAHVREQIHAGAYLPGAKLPRVADWKRELGVSGDTLNKVLSALEQDGLITRAQGSGIFVAEARERPRVRTNILGVPSLRDDGSSTPYWASLLGGIRDGAHAAGYDVLLSKDLDIHRLSKMDGVIWTTADWKLAKRSLSERIPWVPVLWHVPGVPGVAVDEASGVRAAVEHLLELGHRRIAYWAIEWSDQERLAAYRAALQAASIEPDPRWVNYLPKDLQCEFRQASLNPCFPVIQGWLQEGWSQLGCTALLVHNDDMALTALQALREAGLRVPEDVSVVGFDGTSQAQRAHPPLTTIEVPLREVGARGVEMLLRRMQDEPIEDQVLPVRLRIAASTAPIHKRA